MVSVSLQQWQTTRSTMLDEIENAHRIVGGTGRGRRYATEQINHACTTLLSSQFQGFCRDLHTEAVDYFVRWITPEIPIQNILRKEFTLHRKLDQGNPNPGNIGADFNRFGFRFWDRVYQQSKWNRGRVHRLEELNNWRNAIAHQDFDPGKLGSIMKLGFSMVQQWRNACTQLAKVFDQIVAEQLNQLTGTSPW